MLRANLERPAATAGLSVLMRLTDRAGMGV